MDDQLAAYEIGILGNQSYYMHGTAFDPELAAFSPGRLLMLHALEKCFSEKRQVYDFLQNDQDFKRQMSTHQSSLWDWIVCPRSLRGWALLLVFGTVHRWSEWKLRRAMIHKPSPTKEADSARDES